jgi:hypothetical protein
MASQRHSVVWEYERRHTITPVARGLSGGPISLCWHGETLSARRHSGGFRLLRYLQSLDRHMVTQVDTRWLRKQKITHMAWRRVLILMAWGSFSHIRSLRWLRCHWNGIKSLQGAWILWRHKFTQATRDSNDLGSLQRLQFFPTAWSDSLELHFSFLCSLWRLKVTLVARTTLAA